MKLCCLILLDHLWLPCGWTRIRAVLYSVYAIEPLLHAQEILELPSMPMEIFFVIFGIMGISLSF